MYDRVDKDLEADLTSAGARGLIMGCYHMARFREIELKAKHAKEIAGLQKHRDSLATALNEALEKIYKLENEKQEEK